MLVDLGRNDVGRISDPGSVTVTDRMNKRYANRVDIAMKKNEKKKNTQRSSKVRVWHQKRKGQ